MEQVIDHCPVMTKLNHDDIDGLAQDCSNSNALAVELLQSCAKLSICSIHRNEYIHKIKLHLSFSLGEK